MKVNEVLEEIGRIGKKYQASKIIMFGSRAKGTETERSDIDIAVSGIGSSFYDFEEDVQNIPTLLTIDIVNLDTCGNKFLRKDIEEYGRKIYQKV